MLLGLVALAIIGCRGGDDEQSESTVAPALTSTVKASTSGDTGTSDTGMLEVRVTDAPDPSITAVYVTTDNSGGGSSGGGNSGNSGGGNSGGGPPDDKGKKPK